MFVNKNLSKTIIIKNIIRICSNSLFQGFMLLSILLLGLGLEQNLLKKPSLSKEIYFLSGNILGFLGSIILKKKEYILSFLNNKSWFITSLLIGLIIWKENIWLFFLLGSIFSFLILCLFTLSDQQSFKERIYYIGFALITGNTFLSLMKIIPQKVSLVLLSILFAKWHHKKTRKSLKRYNKEDTPSFIYFWIFFFIFYTISGFYYTVFFNNKLPEKHFEFITLTLYIIGISMPIVIHKKYLKFIPTLLIITMGLGLSLQIPSLKISKSLFLIMNLSFGIADIFSISYIFTYANTITECALNFLLFPISILSSILLITYSKQSLINQCKWTIISLFITTIPALLFFKNFLRGNNKKDAILYLPKENSKEKTNSNKEENKAKINRPTESIFFPEVEKLSNREKEVFYLLIKGLKLKEIASELNLATGTIKAISSRIYEKLGVKGKKEFLKRFSEKK